MKQTGQIWRYFRNTEEGFIFGSDKRIYHFLKDDLQHNKELAEGSMVEFKSKGQTAREVTLLTAYKVHPPVSIEMSVSAR